MEAIILYPDQKRLEVLVLSVGRYTIRVVAPHRDDTMELSSSYGQWIDESGTPIEFESFVASGPDDVRRVMENATLGLAAAAVTDRMPDAHR